MTWSLISTINYKQRNEQTKVCLFTRCFQWSSAKSLMPDAQSSQNSGNCAGVRQDPKVEGLPPTTRPEARPSAKGKLKGLDLYYLLSNTPTPSAGATYVKLALPIESNTTFLF